MTREEIEAKVGQAVRYHKHVLLELPTGFGKTKLAIDVVNDLCDRMGRTLPPHRNLSVLLLVAKRVHKQTWKDEIEKWGGLRTDNLTIECYESLKKYRGRTFDILIGDEIHHIGSETRLALFESLTINHMMLGLSATINRSLKQYFKYERDAQIVKCTLQDAIDEDVLPEPRIYVLPLYFDNKVTETLVLNGRKGLPVVHADWNGRYSYNRRNDVEVHIPCTKSQRLDEFNATIEMFKKKYMASGSLPLKNMWLKTCGDRLKWLAQLKNPHILNILRRFKNERTLTFCASIEQTEVLGKNCIHSKNRLAQKVYEDFNNGKIKHITSCQMLNEGINLKNCRIGIYANVHASETITRQRMGRLLRHKRPIVIIPYWKDTREEELVEKMLEEYDRNLIIRINDIGQLKL